VTLKEEAFIFLVSGEAQTQAQTLTGQQKAELFRKNSSGNFAIAV
jgi:hypothetical protein